MEAIAAANFVNCSLKGDSGKKKLKINEDLFKGILQDVTNIIIFDYSFLQVSLKHPNLKSRDGHKLDN